MLIFFSLVSFSNSPDERKRNESKKKSGTDSLLRAHLLGHRVVRILTVIRVGTRTPRYRRSNQRWPNRCLVCLFPFDSCPVRPSSSIPRLLLPLLLYCYSYFLFLFFDSLKSDRCFIFYVTIVKMFITHGQYGETGRHIKKSVTDLGVVASPKATKATIPVTRRLIPNGILPVGAASLHRIRPKKKGRRGSVRRPCMQPRYQRAHALNLHTR